MYFKEESNEIQGISSGENSQEGSVSDERLIEAINDLTEKIDQMNTTEEEVTDEEVTEDPTEVPIEEQPVQKQDVYDLKESIQDISNDLSVVSDYVEYLKTNSEEEARREGETEEPSLVVLAEVATDEETSEEYTIDHGADGHLYLAEQVENADLNDIYSMLWSTRNVLLLFMLIVCVFICFKLLRSALERMLNR